MEKFVLPAVAMMVVVVSANYLVMIPINDWLTWGALTYPCAFLVTDVTNRLNGPKIARRVVYVGFVCAIIVSSMLMEWRIALASATAFGVGQLLDIAVFNRLLRLTWWKPPFIASALGSLIDTCIFFPIAFAGTATPWVTWGIGDFGVKLFFAVILLAPFRAFFTLYGRRVRALSG